jgi:hypothetical protein
MEGRSEKKRYLGNSLVVGSRLGDQSIHNYNFSKSVCVCNQYLFGPRWFCLQNIYNLVYRREYPGRIKYLYFGRWILLNGLSATELRVVE